MSPLDETGPLWPLDFTARLTSRQRDILQQIEKFKDLNIIRVDGLPVRRRRYPSDVCVVTHDDAKKEKKRHFDFIIIDEAHTMTENHDIIGTVTPIPHATFEDLRLQALRLVQTHDGEDSIHWRDEKTALLVSLKNSTESFLTMYTMWDADHRRRLLESLHFETGSILTDMIFRSMVEGL